MTLRARTLLIVGCALTAVLVLHYTGLRFAFVRALTRMENDRVSQQVLQARGELTNEIDTMARVAADYADWNDTYEFAVDRNADFIKSDLADEALRHLRLDVVVIVDASGQVILFRTLHDAARSATLQAEVEPHIAQGMLLTTFEGTVESHRGIVALPSGPLALVTRPIRKSDGSGPSRGVLLMGRRLSNDEIVRIGATIHLAISLAPLPPSPQPGMNNSSVRVSTTDTNGMVGATDIADVYGKPAWTLHLQGDRPLRLEGERLFFLFVLTLAASAIVVAIVTLALLDRLVLRRLTNMSRAVEAVGRTGDLTRRVAPGGHDELSAVGATIDAMLDRLAENRRALEASEDRYRLAEQKALSAARTKSEFLANMSHEIRTPLNGVLGTLRVLSDSPLSADQQESVHTATRCAEGLLGILNDILDFSKIEAGKMTLARDAVNVRDLVDEVLAVFGPIVGDRDLDLLTTANTDVPTTVLGDAVRLRQVLVNLVGNAVKFTSAGHVLVHLSCPTDRESPCLQIDVVDTGTGIPPERVSAIFDSFTQADPATTRQFGGTGLGLTITRRFLQLMGGGISVQSTQGGGSTFTCEIPLVEPEYVAERPLEGKVYLVGHLRRNVRTYAALLRDTGATVVEVAPDETDRLVLTPTARDRSVTVIVCPEAIDAMDELTSKVLDPRVRLVALVKDRRAAMARWPRPVTLLQPPVSRQQWKRILALDRGVRPAARAMQRRFSGRVLLAEDNIVNRKVAVALLEKKGCIVETAVTGREAVSLFDDREYDLIFMDCQMPEMDGYQATRAIRQRKTARVPIVALTADALPEARAKCYECGMDDYLVKPFKVEELQAVLERYLQLEPASATA